MVLKEIALKTGSTEKRAQSIDNLYIGFRNYCLSDSFPNCSEYIKKRISVIDANDTKACEIIAKASVFYCRNLEKKYILPFIDKVKNASIRMDVKEFEEVIQCIMPMYQSIFDKSKPKTTKVPVTKIEVNEVPSVQDVIDNYTPNIQPTSEIEQFCDYLLKNIDVLREFNEANLNFENYPSYEVYENYKKQLDALETFCKTSRGTLEDNIYRLRYDILFDIIEAFMLHATSPDVFFAGIDEELVNQVYNVLYQVDQIAQKYGVLPTIDYKMEIFNRKHGISERNGR
ncbi:MAG: hypothetical protein ACI4WH_01640 [Oscillospiraceae bacterium]